MNSLRTHHEQLSLHFTQPASAWQSLSPHRESAPDMPLALLLVTGLSVLITLGALLEFSFSA